MSIVGWILLAIIAYLAHTAYQRIQHSRKRAEFVRDRRRAAGIPDDDRRPFAVARADALSRKSQQRRDETLSTPNKTRTSARPHSSSRATLDREAAGRLSGIPGTLPGYLKDTLASEAPSASPSYQRQSQHSKAPRSPSPVKVRSGTIDSSPSNAAMKRRASQAPESPSKAARRQAAPTAPSSPSPSKLERHHRGPATKKGDSNQAKVKREAIPGTFGSDPRTSDHEMSEAEPDGHEEQEPKQEPMDEDALPKRAADLGAAPLSALARSTAKKREADELDRTDSEASWETSDGEEHIESHPPSSKRSRKTNKELDPSSSLDFEMALPEEAMADFNPAASSTASAAEPASSRIKRRVDTSDDRQPGEEWIDFEGLRWRIHPETHELERWSDVLEWRSKYRMPRDSLHPMAREEHQVVVHKWLTKHAWEEAKANKLLAFQEAERLADKEKQDKIDAEKMQRKQELLAKIRQTASPNKRIQSYLMQQHKKSLQHRVSQSDMSADISMASNTTLEPDEGTVSMSIDSMSVLDGSTPGKPRSRRISLRANTPGRGETARAGGEQRSANSSTTASPTRRNSPLATPYRAIQYPKQRKAKDASPLVKSFPPPSQ
ncbi:hypothetical protein PANT_9c00193 [Moesziomyces antarcticus T-34]|uniref:Uncharacterized protein n=1 Tax=Pseudozyma antarctica (strain T-34) TaxID=1151754 RepID=M9M0W0_PSEA3|nr:hypothetical protein PANT_9c00193 [Moesziomyces antarcticus T-34]